MYLLREAQAVDENSILTLAQHLNTLNLSPDRQVIREEVVGSLESFIGGDNPDSFDPQRRFMFVLEDTSGKVVGTSALHAQHGTFEEPHIFFRVQEDERYFRLQLPNEEMQDVYKRHKVLMLGETFEGPTEVGGLVLDPSLRGHPEKLGTLLSLGRFMFIAGKRPWFRDRVLAELLPPLQKDEEGESRSPLWDALGSRLTGIDYDSADKLSRVDKHFIHRLFPRMPLYASLLPEAAQAVIGKVGPQSMGAKTLLERIGFYDSGNVDPFDGGPHFEAVTNALTPVRSSIVCDEIQSFDGEEPGFDRYLIAHFAEEAPRFRAAFVRAKVDPIGTDGRHGRLLIGREAFERLGLEKRSALSKVLAFRP